MTELIEKIRTELLEARKAKNEVEVGVLNPLLSDIIMLGKNDGNRLPNDSDALTAIRRFLTGVNETIVVCEERGLPCGLQKKEKEMLEKYLPIQMSEDRLRSEITKILEVTTSPNIGLVMKELKTKFGDMYDTKLASTLTKIHLGIGK